MVYRRTLVVRKENFSSLAIWAITFLYKQSEEAGIARGFFNFYFENFAFYEFFIFWISFLSKRCYLKIAATRFKNLKILEFIILVQSLKNTLEGVFFRTVTGLFAETCWNLTDIFQFFCLLLGINFLRSSFKKLLQVGVAIVVLLLSSFTIVFAKIVKYCLKNEIKSF